MTLLSDIEIAMVKKKNLPANKRERTRIKKQIGRLFDCDPLSKKKFSRLFAGRKS